ncbi:MAG: phosphatidylserine decarboxylase [Cyclobacteriaceae bacterium]
MTFKKYNMLTYIRHNAIIVISILFLLSGCSAPEKQVEYGKATQELIDILNTHPEVKVMLESSIVKAAEVNPDLNTNPVRSLEEYYEFVSWAEQAMPWTLIDKEDHADVFEDIYQGIAYFYFLIDQPLQELEGKGFHNNSLQYAEPYASWLTTFSKSWGSYLDSEDSWNEQYYKMASEDPGFGLQNGWYEDGSNWKTFNQFFSRHLKSPEVRPIAEPDQDNIVVSFADSEPQGVWAIDSSSNLVAEDGVPVKSATLRSVSALIGEGSEYKDAFANGTFTHSFLNVNDYHRYHFPVGGVVKEVRIIQGSQPIGGKLWWDKDNNRYAYDPSAKTGWQVLETRGCVIVDTDEYGLVALLPIGMVVVSSVNFDDNIQPGAQVKKGDPLGHFAFGGSDFVVLFQRGISFSLDAPKREDGKGYEHMLMGEMLGALTKE